MHWFNSFVARHFPDDESVRAEMQAGLDVVLVKTVRCGLPGVQARPLVVAWLTLALVNQSIGSRSFLGHCDLGIRDSINWFSPFWVTVCVFVWSSSCHAKLLDIE